MICSSDFYCVQCNVLHCLLVLLSVTYPCPNAAIYRYSIFDVFFVWKASITNQQVVKVNKPWLLCNIYHVTATSLLLSRYYTLMNMQLCSYWVSFAASSVSLMLYEYSALSIQLYYFTFRKGCRVLWWACLSVCLSACISQKPDDRTSPVVWCMSRVTWLARFSTDCIVICYILTFGGWRHIMGRMPLYVCPKPTRG